MFLLIFTYFHAPLSIARCTREIEKERKKERKKKRKKERKTIGNKKGNLTYCYRKEQLSGRKKTQRKKYLEHIYGEKKVGARERQTDREKKE